jgi:hypothetical protein
MAHNARTLDLHSDKKRVPVTVGADRKHLQPISGTLTLRPEFIARAAEEGHVSALERSLEGFLVHEAQHQNFAGRIVLDNCRDQPLHFLKIDRFIHSRSPAPENKKPAEAFGVSGLKTDECWLA